MKEWPLPPINTLTPPTDKIKYAALTRPGLRRILIPTVSVTRSSIYDPRTKPDLHVLNRLRDKTEQGGVNVMGPHGTLLVLLLHIVVGGKPGPRHRDQASQWDATPSRLKELG